MYAHPVKTCNSVALDVAMIDQYDELLPKLERHIRACAKGYLTSTSGMKAHCLA